MLSILGSVGPRGLILLEPDCSLVLESECARLFIANHLCITLYTSYLITLDGVSIMMVHNFCKTIVSATLHKTYWYLLLTIIIGRYSPGLLYALMLQQLFPCR